MTHDDAYTLLAAYALYILDDEDEVREIEGHLALCAMCRRELDQLQETTVQLAEAVRRESPPTALRERILGAVSRQRPEPSRPTTGDLLGHGRPRARIVWGVAAAVFIVALGILDAWLWHQRSVLQAQVKEDGRLLGVLTEPSAKTIVLRGAGSGRVRLIFSPGAHDGVLVASGLGDPGPGRVYQVWLVARGRPESVGIFRPRAGEVTVLPVVKDFGRYQMVAISVEHGPRGASAPTTPPILTATLSGSG